MASKIIDAAEFSAWGLVQNLVKMVNSYALTAKNKQNITRHFYNVRHLHNYNIFCWIKLDLIRDVDFKDQV